ncbi:MAG: N-acetyltransferase [Opitutales bacterium]|jgi:L-amino acid N-acyltransferase YncA|nr:N-acetyltransferase [Opitutales bacterium]
MCIRIATKNEWADVIRIYNEAVDTRVSTADTEYVTLESRKAWLEEHEDARYPIYVKIVDDEVVGWCSISSYRSGRPAVRGAGEISYYVSANRRNQGIASELIEHLLSKCPDLGIRVLFGILLESNAPSMYLLKKYGFSDWGRFPDVAEIDGERFDHVYLGLNLEERE